MTVSANKFNNFVNALPTKLHNLGSDTLKVMLTNTLPVATNAVYADVSAGEVANGNGYSTGGATATLSSSGQTSGTYKLKLNNAVVTATGAVGPFQYVILYNATASAKDLILWYDYGSAVTLANADTFNYIPDSSAGVLTIA